MSLRGLYNVVLLSTNSTRRWMCMLRLSGGKVLLLLHSYNLCLLLCMMLRLLLHLVLPLVLPQLHFSPGVLTVLHLFALPLGLLMLSLLRSASSGLGLVLELGLVVAARLLLMGNFDVLKSLETFEARLKRRCPRFSISGGCGSVR